MEKKYIFLVLLLLTVGFASVNTIIDIKGKVNMSLLESDLEVIFKEVLLNKENNDKAFIIEEGKSFIYSSDELVNINQTSNIDYTIMNKSHQYDMEVKVSCTTDYKEYLSYTSETIDKSILIEAGEVVTGNIITELIKEKEFGNSLILKCTLYYVPVSRDTVVEEKEYIVSFDTGYEEKVSDIKIKYYEVYGSLPTLERKNYKFLGWYTSEDIKVENNSLVKIKDNHTLHAKWERICEYDIGKTWEFNYTGSEQTFTTPCDGEYKIELWGAQGGAATTTYIGGYGGYSSGEIYFKISETIYINVGGQGESSQYASSKIGAKGGYNGGGTSNPLPTVNHIYGSGGEATHIALKPGVLSTLANNADKIILVAGGGGGGRWQINETASRGNGGSGGGSIGVAGEQLGWNKTMAYGGTQIAGGTYKYISGSKIEDDKYGLYHEEGRFGQGGNSVGQSAGGGGYYGGASGFGGGAGGSGYIGNPLLTNKVMYCYNCTISNEDVTRTISTTCTSTTPTSNCPKQGNGYAQITLISYPY